MTELQWVLIGEVVLVQVQVRPMKLGDKPRIYTPEGCLTEVERITLTPEGILADIDGQTVYDVHGTHHPQSRSRGNNGISFGFTSHYDQMQARFGPHLSVGIAGENMIVQTDKMWTLDDFVHGVALESPTGERIVMNGVTVIDPCEPFTAFCMGKHDVTEERQVIKENLQFLLHGMRGFCAELTDSGPHNIGKGYTLWAAQTS